MPVIKDVSTNKGVSVYKEKKKYGLYKRVSYTYRQVLDISKRFLFLYFPAVVLLLLAGFLSTTESFKLETLKSDKAKLLFVIVAGVFLFLYVICVFLYLAKTAILSKKLRHNLKGTTDQKGTAPMIKYTNAFIYTSIFNLVLLFVSVIVAMLAKHNGLIFHCMSGCVLLSSIILLQIYAKLESQKKKLETLNFAPPTSQQKTKFPPESVK